MLWLQDASFISWDSGNEHPTRVFPDELDSAVKRRAIKCGQSFALLHEDYPVSQSARVEACKVYSEVFANDSVQAIESTAFDLFGLCILPPSDEDISQNVIELCKRLNKFEKNSRVSLVLDCLSPSNTTFENDYIAAGGTADVAAHLASVNHRRISQIQWKSDLQGIASSDFDKSFCEWLLADSIECESWLLSFFLQMLLSYNSITSDDIRIHAATLSPETVNDTLLYSILVKNKTQMVDCLFQVSTDLVFIVHLLDLAEMDTTMFENANHTLDLDLAISQYCEMIVSDSEISAATGREVGLRQWIPVYISRSGLEVTERILGDVHPALRKGLVGKVVKKIEQRRKRPDAPIEQMASTILSRIHAAKERDEANHDKAWTEVAEVLNTWILTVPEGERHAVVEECGPIFDEIKGLKGDVVVALLVSLLDGSDVEIKPQLENLMFQRIVENCEMP